MSGLIQVEMSGSGMSVLDGERPDRDVAAGTRYFEDDGVGDEWQAYAGGGRAVDRTLGASGSEQEKGIVNFSPLLIWEQEKGTVNFSPLLI